MASNNQAAPIQESIIPEPDAAVAQFQSRGGRLTLFSEFGHDALAVFPELMEEREQRFFQRYPDFAPFFIQLLMAIIHYFERDFYTLYI